VKAHPTALRSGIVVLLIASAVLFLIGSTIERNNRHHEATATKTTETTGETQQESGGESTATPKHVEGASTETTNAETGSGEVGATILGVNTESLALSVVAVVLSVLLAAAVWLQRWPRLVLLAVLAFALVFAAGDARELVHQLDESNAGLAAAAAAVLTLHAALATLVVLAIRPRRETGLASANNAA
jgi:hypothetical protein